MRRSLLALIATLSTSASAVPSAEVVCTYAPSQSKAVAAVSGAAAGGAAATTGAMTAATGLTVVAHSSGALILTGTSGYIAGTLGTTAATVAAAPVVVGVGLIVGGTAVTVELVCAAKNHPEQVKKVNEAAAEFATRFTEAIKAVKVASADMAQTVAPATAKTVNSVKLGAAEVWQYAYRKSDELRQTLGK